MHTNIQPVVTTGLTTGLTNCCIVYTADCQPVVQPGLATVLNGKLFVQHGCQSGLTAGLTTGWMYAYTIQPVVKPVVQPVWQPVVSCKRGLRKLQFAHALTSTRLVENRCDPNKFQSVAGEPQPCLNWDWSLVFQAIRTCSKILTSWHSSAGRRLTHIENGRSCLSVVDFYLLRPREGCEVLWWACLSVCLSARVSQKRYFRLSGNKLIWLVSRRYS